MLYPEVLSERETLDLVLQGRSIARYGDGEFKLCRGGGIKSQVANKKLGARLSAILQNAGECLVGIPNIRAVQQAAAKNATPLQEQKAQFWSKYQSCSYLLNDDVQYGSAFITRPDSAPWLDTPEYWEDIASLWRDQDVTLVRGKTKSLTAEVLNGAREVTEIIAPQKDAFGEYDAILERIGTPKRALLCLGPTATVLAADLCAKGVHAIDLGHIGLFYKKHLKGEPMWLSKDDKLHDSYVRP